MKYRIHFFIPIELELELEWNNKINKTKQNKTK